MAGARGGSRGRPVRRRPDRRHHEGRLRADAPEDLPGHAPPPPEGRAPAGRRRCASSAETPAARRARRRAAGDDPGRRSRSCPRRCGCAYPRRARRWCCSRGARPTSAGRPGAALAWPAGFSNRAEGCAPTGLQRRRLLGLRASGRGRGFGALESAQRASRAAPSRSPNGASARPAAAPAIRPRRHPVSPSTLPFAASAARRLAHRRRFRPTPPELGHRLRPVARRQASRGPAVLVLVRAVVGMCPPFVRQAARTLPGREQSRSRPFRCDPPVARTREPGGEEDARESTGRDGREAHPDPAERRRPNARGAVAARRPRRHPPPPAPAAMRPLAHVEGDPSANDTWSSQR